MLFDTPFDSKDFATITADLLQSLRNGEGGRPVLTDDTEGSVVRTLSEAFARELAVCYQQLRYVYANGYLDTAEGVALDNVVALLGVSRQRAGHIEGSVIFSRPQPAPEDIPIPPGTQIAGRDVPVFETTEAAVIHKGFQEAAVKVRSLEPGSDPVAAGKLSLLPRPIWGVDQVINAADLLPKQREESDDELRERTRHIFQKANLGTTAAIEQTVRALGISQVLVNEPPLQPGTVEVILGDTDISNELLDRARNAVQEVRPAGIRVNVFLSDPVFVGITATLVLREEATAEQKKTITTKISTALQAYFNSLKTGELVHATKINAILTTPPEVAKLIAPDQGKGSILSAFTLVNGKLSDVGSSHTSNNGDVRINSVERAFLDFDRLPLTLSLEPPLLDVWLDVEITPADPQQIIDVKALTLTLQATLDTFKTGETITFKQLAEVLATNQFKAVEFHLLHSQTNLLIVLGKEPDSDTLNSREQLRVGRIYTTGSQT